MKKIDMNRVKEFAKKKIEQIDLIQKDLEELKKSIKRIETDITLAKYLSELKVCKNDRVVIYDDSDNMVFDSDAFGFDEPELFGYNEYWEMLEETICRVSDVTENGKRTIFIFMCY